MYIFLNMIAEDTFCMKVHSCNVDDGKGDSVEILDEDGCAKDKYVLNNLEYPTDLMAGQEAHIYKFADRSELFFQCQVTKILFTLILPIYFFPFFKV